MKKKRPAEGAAEFDRRFDEGKTFTTSSISQRPG